MATGMDVIDVLRERDIDIVGGLEPYDALVIEKALDACLGDEAVQAEEDRAAALEAAFENIAAELKRRFEDWATDTIAEAKVGDLARYLTENFRDLVDDVVESAQREVSNG